MELKLIHTADVHFDTPFSGLMHPQSAAVLRQDLRTAFSAIVEQAKGADMLLISGDLFDAKRVSRSLLDFLQREFAKIPETSVFIAAGNHDVPAEGSVYQTFDFGKNVHIFGKEAECVETEKADIYGVSFGAANEERRLLSEISVKNPHKRNVLVMHGNLQGEDYNPFTLTELQNSGMDYVALGHIHKRSDLKQVGATYYAYPGCPQGRGFDETGEKGALAVSVQKGRVAAEFFPTCVRQYLDILVDVTGCEDIEEIRERVSHALLGEQHIYRIRLTGSCGFPIETEVLLAGISAFEAEVRNETVPEQDLDAIQKEYTLKGLFTKFALAEKAAMSEEAFSMAFQAGFSLIENEEQHDH